MAEWQARPLDPVYPVIFVDAIRVKIRDGNVVNRPIYLAVGEFDVEIRKIICTTNAIWVFDSAGWLGCCYPGQRSRRWALALNANDAVRLSWTRSARAHRMSADAGRLA